MNKGDRTRWRVYFRRSVICEDPEENVEWPWAIAGETIAVSEAKAINNVRFRVAGKTSQYKPLETSGHYDVFIEWKAEEMRR